MVTNSSILIKSFISHSDDFWQFGLELYQLMYSIMHCFLFPGMLSALLFLSMAQDMSQLMMMDQAESQA